MINAIQSNVEQLDNGACCHEWPNKHNNQTNNTVEENVKIWAEKLFVNVYRFTCSNTTVPAEQEQSKNHTHTYGAYLRSQDAILIFILFATLSYRERDPLAKGSPFFLQTHSVIDPICDRRPAQCHLQSDSDQICQGLGQIRLFASSPHLWPKGPEKWSPPSSRAGQLKLVSPLYSVHRKHLIPVWPLKLGQQDNALLWFLWPRLWEYEN